MKYILIGGIFMSEYVINGGKSLTGSVNVSGAKNAVLPLLSAALLCTDGVITLTNCPDITDVTYTLEILKLFGSKVSFAKGQITVDSRSAEPAFIPEDLTMRLRSASLFLGSALARFSKAEQCLPGGCKLGSRPIDMHLSAFAQMGVVNLCEDDKLICKGSPCGADITLRFPSVGTTENIILCASLSKGETRIMNAAKEPEICELCSFINAMGGNIKGAGSSVIVIQGVEKLKGINYNIMGDRIEAATFMTLAMATDGEITVCGIEPDTLNAVTDVLALFGGVVHSKDDRITVRRSGHFILPAGMVKTAPYPGFPTDAQSLVMSMLTLSVGSSLICENMFENRFMLASELTKMGADISVCGNTARVTGVRSLYGSRLVASDLRSGAALVVAALSAKGRSTIANVCYILRGYSEFDKKLRALGADIMKTED